MLNNCIHFSTILLIDQQTSPNNPSKSRAMKLPLLAHPIVHEQSQGQHPYPLYHTYTHTCGYHILIQDNERNSFISQLTYPPSLIFFLHGSTIKSQGVFSGILTPLLSTELLSFLTCKRRTVQDPVRQHSYPGISSLTKALDRNEISSGIQASQRMITPPGL